MPTLKLGHIELFVRSPSRSKQFYRDVLLFDLVAEQGENHIWLKSGEIELLLRPANQPPRAQTYQNALVGFVMYTDDLPATLARLKERGIVPQGQDGSDGCPTFTDPDGHWIQIVNPKDH
jgi:catechol 2,3-dioxygenase-like lactoylglutathione lyase family enzyme